MKSQVKNISLSNAAIIAGIALLIMTLVTPFAEIYAFPKLFKSGDALETTKNIISKMWLFRLGIFCYLINFICDLILSWSLYLLLKPANNSLSLLAASFRFFYTLIGFASLLNLVTLLRLLNTTSYLALLSPNQLHTEVMFCINAFRSGWSFSLIVFGIYLLLLGYLVIKSTYIPTILGFLLIVAGLGWLVDELQPLLYPQFVINSTIINITGIFELIFMLWLLIRGGKIPDLT